jgi:enoyl-[acyl-carrier-protein] reductase (NADH)
VVNGRAHLSRRKALEALSVDRRREEDEMEAAPVLYLGYARQVTGEVLHADGGAHARRS